MAKVLNIKDFRSKVKAGQKPTGALRFAQPGSPIATAEERTMSFVFSDGSVDRYGDTIDAKGWVLAAFNANPVALFGHDAGSVENVIGKAKNVRVQGDKLIGDIEFAEASVNPNAETVYQLVKGGYLNTVSVGFQPIEWAQTKDKSRPGGIDFKKQELMEISIVPVPANPNAVALAKAAGIEIDRISLLERADDIVWSRDAAPVINKKGLYAVSDLATLLLELGWLVDSATWEAEYEGDGSEVPQMLADALKQLGAAMVAMTAEEVAELLARFGGDDQEKEFTPVQRFLETVSKAMKRPAGDQLQVKVEMDAEKLRALIDQRIAEIGVAKAGKKLSAASQSTITDACAKMMDAHDCLKAMLDELDDDDSSEVTKATEAQIRARKAKALKLKVASL